MTRELLELHAQTLFTHDPVGNIVAVNEPGGGRAPRVFLAWTEDEVVCRVRVDLAPELTARVHALLAAPGARCLAAICDALSAPVVEAGPVYRFPEGIAERPGAVLATEERWLHRWLPDWLPDVATRQPMMVVLVDDAAVAVCACARRPGAASEAGVETHPDFRGRGHAVTVTAAWARALRERGVIPLYSTSSANVASQRVAAKLGLIQVGKSASIP